MALDRLRREIALHRDFAGLDEAVFLSLVWTWRCLQRLGRRFFATHGLSDAQFNVLMILADYADEPLRQHELADILVVNRASIGSVLDLMDRNGWVRRVVDPHDRRAQRVSLTPGGVRKLQAVREPYYRLVVELLASCDSDALARQIVFFDKLRSKITAAEESEASRIKPVGKARKQDNG